MWPIPMSDMTENQPSPEQLHALIEAQLALSMVTATAVMAGLRALHGAYIINDDVLHMMAVNLQVNRNRVSKAPHVEEHFELLTDMVLSGLKPR